MNRSSLSMLMCAALSLCFASVSTAAEPAPTDAERIERWERMLPESPRGLGPTIEDREAWQKLGQADRFKNVVKQAERLAAEPIPELPDELYLDFSRTGNRDRYQRVNNQRQGRIGILALAECIENQGRFLPALEESIRAVCGEKSWVLPAHDRGLKTFKGIETNIDLGASLFSWNLATVRYWLGDKLGPDARKLIDAELERRIFAPFASGIKSGKPHLWWLSYKNNWNAVCLSGVTGAALTTIESRERRAYFAAMAEKYIRYYLEGFTPDGYCSEGLGYWNYGFGHFVLLAETLRDAGGSKFDLLDRPNVRQIALFPRRLEILPGIYPAFADCHPGAQPSSSIMSLLNARYVWNLNEFKSQPTGSIAQPCTVALYGFPNRTIANGAADQSTATQTPPRDWFSDAGVLICRPAPDVKHGLGAAMKGGHNAEQHNHNDVGSFVVALGRSTPLVDPGNEIYTARTFGINRFKSNVINSFGHPVPRVAGKLQFPGRKAAARVLKTEFTDTADTLVLDLSAAYDVKQLKRLARTFVFSRDGKGKLTVIDTVEFDSPQSFGTALVTFGEWEQLAPNRLRIGKSPDAVIVEIESDGGEFRVTSEKIEEDLPCGREPIRIGVELTEPTERATIKMTITPAG